MVNKVKRKIISQSYEHGGIKMLDFKHLIVGAKIGWIKRYMDFGNPDWKVLFENLNSKQNLKLFLRCNFSPKDIPNKLPDYYTDSLNTVIPRSTAGTQVTACLVKAPGQRGVRNVSARPFI